MIAVSMPGGWELVVILFIVLLLFGARKLPELAGSMGKSIKEFRKASKGVFDEDDRDDSADAADGAASGRDPDVER